MLRITSGSLRGRKIQAPKGQNTRPTSEKVREGVFNVLANLCPLQGVVAADLFAGSGALGIEALSRGAEHVTFVEFHAKTAALIRSNLTSVELPRHQWQVESTQVVNWLRKLESPNSPTLIFADPPYAGPHALETLQAIARSKVLTEGILVVLETDRRNRPEIPDGLELLRAKSYGDTEVLYCRKTLINVQAEGETQ